MTQIIGFLAPTYYTGNELLAPDTAIVSARGVNKYIGALLLLSFCLPLLLSSLLSPPLFSLTFFTLLPLNKIFTSYWVFSNGMLQRHLKTQITIHNKFTFYSLTQLIAFFFLLMILKI